MHLREGSAPSTPALFSSGVFLDEVVRAVPEGIVLAMLVVAVAMVFLEHRKSAEQAARNVYVLVNFVLVLNYTIVILDSFDMCAALSMTAAESGRMVGNYMLGFCFGACCMWFVKAGRPDMWRHAVPKAIILGLLLQVAGAAAYVLVAVQATQTAQSAASPKVPAGVFHTSLPATLMASRFVAGVGSGWCQQLYVTAQLHLTPVQERPEHTGRWVLSGMIAIGLGPMVASIVQMADGRRGAAPNFVPVGLAQLVAVAGALGAVVLYHPDLSEVEDRMAEAAGAGGAPGQPVPFERSAGRRLLIMGCLLMGLLRGFGIAAIEAVMALLFEDTFHWDQRATGVVIGAVFLCCIPLKIVHRALGPSLPVAQWIRLLAALAMLGCCLLSAQACGTKSNMCACTLVLAGALLFPTLYLGESLACGIMHQHVLPAGSRFDGNHCQLYYNIAQGLGRFLGPWTARFVVQIAGQNSFAIQQATICLVFVLIFESFVNPTMQTHKR